MRTSAKTMGTPSSTTNLPITFRNTGLPKSRGTEIFISLLKTDAIPLLIITASTRMKSA